MIRRFKNVSNMFFQMAHLTVQGLKEILQQLCHSYTQVMVLSGQVPEDGRTLVLLNMKDRCIQYRTNLTLENEQLATFTQNWRNLRRNVLEICGNIINQVDYDLIAIQDVKTRPGTPT